MQNSHSRTFRLVLFYESCYAEFFSCKTEVFGSRCFRQNAALPSLFLLCIWLSCAVAVFTRRKNFDVSGAISRSFVGFQTAAFARPWCGLRTLQLTAGWSARASLSIFSPGGALICKLILYIKVLKTVYFKRKHFCAMRCPLPQCVSCLLATGWHHHRRQKKIAKHYYNKNISIA